MSRRDAAARALDELLRRIGHQAAVDLRVTITPTHGAEPMLLVKGGHLHRAWEERVWVRQEHFHTPPGHRDAAESGILSTVIANADDPSGWLQQDEAAPGTAALVSLDLGVVGKDEALRDLQRRCGVGPGLPLPCLSMNVDHPEQLCTHPAGHGPLSPFDDRNALYEHANGEGAWGPIPATPKIASGDRAAGPVIVDEAIGIEADWSGYTATSVPQGEVDRRVSLAIRHLAAALGVEVDELLTLTVTPVAVTANVLEPGKGRIISRSTRRGAFYTYRPLGWRKPKGDA